MGGNIFGERIKQLRKNKGYTQQQLAKLLGISSSAVGMYEQGRREPDNATLSNLCKILDTSTDYLIGFSAMDTEVSQDVNEVIDDFTKMLMMQKGLMFNGQPMSKEEKEKVIIAIKSAAAIVIPDNKE